MTDNTAQVIVIGLIILCCILFAGTPDLMDAIIKVLMK